MSSNPLDTQKRRLEDGYEYVEVTFVGNWVGPLKYQSHDDSPNKEFYKRYLCYMCSYPTDEWKRIEDVVVAPVEDGVTLTVKFKNLGKWIEQLVKESAFPNAIMIYHREDGGLCICEGVDELVDVILEKLNYAL